MKVWLARVQASLPLRAWNRYGRARGGVLAGGVAYAAFFSLFPLLAVSFTVFGLFVRNGSSLQATVIKAVNDGVGTAVISNGSGSQGIVSIDTLVGGNTLTLTGIIGLVTLLFTGLSWLDSMREGIRAMFGQTPLQGNFVLTKLRDIAVLASIGVTILASTVVGFGVSTLTGTVLGAVGLSSSWLASIVLGALSTLVVFGVDVLVFLVLFRLLGGVSLPSSDLRDAALFGGVALGVLKQFAGVLLNGASHNKFLATAGLLLGLLIWLNLVSRVTLVAASWGATVALDRQHLVEQVPVTATGVPGQRRDHQPGPVAVPRMAYTPAVGTRGVDRVSVAAGAVLGAAALVAVRTGARAVRTVNGAVSTLLDRKDDA